jgi:hypothetical protein
MKVRMKKKSREGCQDVLHRSQRGIAKSKAQTQRALGIAFTLNS